MVVISEKELYQVMSRSRVKLWEWKADGMGMGLEDEEVKELNCQWFDGSHRKLRQTLKSSITANSIMEG